MSEELELELMDDDNFFDPADFEDEGFDGDHTDETEVEETEAETEVESEVEKVADAAAEPTEQEEQPMADQPELFELNYMGNVEKHTKEEMIALAQMGKDRNRILQQRDTLQQFKTQNEGVLDDLNRIAQKYGVSAADLLVAVERNHHRSNGKSDEEAEALVRAERAERKLSANQSEQEAQHQRQAAQQRQQQDIDNFILQYPNVDPKTIPQTVWQEVRNGDLLVNAYARYELAQLRAEVQRLRQAEQQKQTAQKQNEENKQKSLGSMKSGSSAQKRDDFMSGFESVW